MTTDDVLLLARKNVDLHQLLGEFIDERKAAKEGTKGKAKGKAKAKS